MLNYQKKLKKLLVGRRVSQGGIHLKVIIYVPNKRWMNACHIAEEVKKSM